MSMLDSPAIKKKRKVKTNGVTSQDFIWSVDMVRRKYVVLLPDLEVKNVR